MVGLLGRYFFTRLLRVGTKAGRLRTRPSCGIPAESQSSENPPSCSPELLGISLLHLGAFFHELHVFVQQIQPPLRVAFQHLKLILIAGARLGNVKVTWVGSTEVPATRNTGGGVGWTISGLSGSSKGWLASPGAAPAWRRGRQEAGGNPHLLLQGRAWTTGPGPGSGPGPQTRQRCLSESGWPARVWKEAKPLQLAPSSNPLQIPKNQEGLAQKSGTEGMSLCSSKCVEAGSGTSMAKFPHSPRSSVILS